MRPYRLSLGCLLFALFSCGSPTNATSDAGVTNDAGITSDAGVTVDAGPTPADQCRTVATAICAWAYRCPNSGYTYINEGTSEADCVARYGWSGASGNCSTVTSLSQGCSPPTTFQTSKLAGCVAEMGAAACTADGPLLGANCSTLCQ